MTAVLKNITSKVPLVVVIGATGTGKSNLALEIATRYNGEIISADSMQVYKGLDIITNKVTKAEREIAPHHFLDIINPMSRYNVQDFRKAALPLIEELQTKGKLPIIVGGTNYYIESLLWNVLISEDSDSNELLFERDKKYYNGDNGKYWTGCDLTTEQLFKELQEVDPEFADIVHPNERRKVVRALQVHEQTGKKHSDWLKEQRQQDGGSGLGGPLRFPNSVIFWIDCEQDILHSRLDSRVDKMIDLGLLKELQDFHTEYNRLYLLENDDEPEKNDELPSHYSTGIFQSIGFKEFHKFLILPEDKKSSKEGQKFYNEGIERLKLVTRKYARRQLKWMVNRFFLREDREIPDIYRVDGTDVSLWDKNVTKISQSVLDAIIKGEKIPIEKYKMDPSKAPTTFHQRTNKEKHFCEICNIVLLGEYQYEAHIKGNKHRQHLKRKMDENKNPSENDSETPLKFKKVEGQEL